MNSPKPTRRRPSATADGSAGPTVLLLVSLPDAQGPFAAFFGCELGWPLLPRSGEAELDRVAIQLVDPQVRLPFGRPLRHGVVDGLGLLGRVDAEFGLEIGLPAEGNGCLAVLRDPLA